MSNGGNKPESTPVTTIETQRHTLLVKEGFLAIVSPPLGHLAVEQLREKGAYVVSGNGGGESGATTNIFLLDMVAEGVVPSGQEITVRTVTEAVRSLAE